MPSSTASPDAVVAWPFRRFPTLVEATARVDFPALSGTFDAATMRIEDAWAGIRAQHVAALIEQATRLMPDAASTSTAWLDRLQLLPVDAAPIYAAIVDAISAGQQGALDEAKAQGVVRMPAPAAPADVAAAAGAHDRARALETILAGGLLQTVRREGVRVAAARLDAAAAITRILGDRPTRGERVILKGGSTGGVNEGRLSVIRTITIGTASITAAPGDAPASEQIGYLYATELLDDATCDPCAGVDGTQYESLADAENDYPGLGGGYVWCEGRENCRGSLVVVYADVVPPTVDGGSSQAQAIADRVARDQIRQDAIERRAAADAREAFRAIPPPDTPPPAAPDVPTPPPSTPPAGLVVQALRDAFAGTRVDVTQADAAWNAERLTGMFQSQGLTERGMHVEAKSQGSRRGGDRVLVTATIRDAERTVGTLYRTIDTARGVVSHDLFKLEPELQGQGISKQLMASHVAEYDRAGITRVEVGAGGQNGKYTWARYGFDFATPTDLTVMQDLFRREVATRAGITPPALAARMPETLRLIDAARHPWDFATLLIDEAGVQTTGKEIMLRGKGWSGVLDLTPGSAGRRIFDAYTRGA